MYAHTDPDAPSGDTRNTDNMITYEGGHLAFSERAKASSFSTWLNTFTRAQNDEVMSETASERVGYNVRRAAVRTANTALSRQLKGRHLQMMAIGGSIGECSRGEGGRCGSSRRGVFPGHKT